LHNNKLSPGIMAVNLTQINPAAARVSVPPPSRPARIEFRLLR
jgi:hypothetical protein